ncbi:hypothetical protein M2360_004560 [Rhizobium sp. SG_E_25_P2]|nr:hypothetical protein [Rhizobium sp. SG_E_25_P2]
MRHFFLYLALSISTMLWSPAYANFIPSNVGTSPESFAESLIITQRIEGQFFLCLSDIRIFNKADSKNCKYTIEKLNIHSYSMQMGDINNLTLDSLKNILVIIEEKSEK